MVAHRPDGQTRSLADVQRFSDCYDEYDGLGDASARTANRRVHDLVISADEGGLAGAGPFHSF